ncbi:MAG: molybdopterin-dependent oxidoreductase, partial [bacterium]
MSCYVRGIFPIIFFAAFFHAFIVFGQTKNSSQATAEFQLTVGGEVERPLKLSLADLAKLPHRTVQAKEHNGQEATFEGVPLVEILQLAGINFGEKLRGQALATYLLIEASDGYKAVFALPELDSAFTDRVVLLADRRNNKPLAET